MEFWPTPRCKRQAALRMGVIYTRPSTNPNVHSTRRIDFFRTFIVYFLAVFTYPNQIQIMSSEPSKDDKRPRQASPARSFRSRMGTMLRRNSLGFSRPNTPFRSESKSSLRLSTDAPPPNQEAQAHVPSPVQESAREAEGDSATAGPSTLSKEVTASPDAAPAELKAEAEPAPEISTQAPEPTAGVAAQTSSAPAPKEEPSANPPVEETQPAPAAPVEPVQDAKPQAPATEERRTETFAFTDEINTKPAVAPEPAVEAAPPVVECTPAAVFVAEPEAISEPAKETRVEAIPDLHDHSFAWRDEPHVRAVSPKHSRSTIADGAPSYPVMASPESMARSISPKPSKGSVSSSYGRVIVDTPGGRVNVSFDPHEQYEDEPRRGRSRASSVRYVLLQQYVFSYINASFIL